MKKTDVFLQSISIVAGLLMAVRALIVDETFFMSILYLQFVLLVWQLVSAIFLLKNIRIIRRRQPGWCGSF